MTTFADDLDTMFEDLPTVTVVHEAVTATAFLDVWDAEVLPGMESGVVGEGLALTFPTARFPGLVIGSALTVDGVSYTVKDRRRPPDMVDGAVTHVLLTKAA